jgi:iron complex transport system substrate-binding protein
LFILVAAALMVAACGDSSGTPASTGTAPTTTAVPKPSRIVSLSPTATEMLYAVGAGSQVVAVDDQSNYPAQAPKTDLSGYKPNLEAIAAKNPDLVVMSDDAAGLVAKLQTLKITALVLPSATTIDDSYSQMEKLGVATGNVSGATEAVLKMKTRMSDLVKSVPKPARPLRYYHELDNTLYTATSKTFIGEVYKLAGLQNIADAADKTSSGYPQLSAEYLVQQNPDLVFLADTKCCGQNAKTFGARPGFDQIAAVKNGGVVELDDDIASRWGPRTPDLLDAVVKALAKLPVASTK